MNVPVVNPQIPEGLAKDLLEMPEIAVRYLGEDGQPKEIQHSAMAPLWLRIELRPFIVAGEYAPDESGALSVEHVTAEVPLDAVQTVDVDDIDHHGGPEDDDVVVFPVARWVRDPREGLVRLSRR